MEELAPELLTPYQISPTAWLPLELPRTQLTPPPLTDEMPTLSLSEKSTSASPTIGAEFRFTVTAELELKVAVACWTRAIDPPPPLEGFTVRTADCVPF